MTLVKTWNILFGILGQLLKQTSDRTLQKRFIFNVWSFAALVLSSCFSGAILGAIVNWKEISINSLEDLVISKSSVLIPENSWLWWQYENERQWNVSLDFYLNVIKHRVLSVPSDSFNSKVQFFILRVTRKPGNFYDSKRRI